MIVLNAEAISQAARSEDILQAVSTAMLLQESGDFIQPDRMHMDTGEGTLLLMPSGGRKRKPDRKTRLAS